MIPIYQDNAYRRVKKRVLQSGHTDRVSVGQLGWIKMVDPVFICKIVISGTMGYLVGP